SWVSSLKRNPPGRPAGVVAASLRAPFAGRRFPGPRACQQIRYVEPQLAPVGAEEQIAEPPSMFDKRLPGGLVAQRRENVVFIAGMANNIGIGARAIASRQEALQRQHEQR